jgi:hypothetical protein
MSQLPTYSFLPWLRHGVGNTITTPDVESGGATLRASVQVKLQLEGEPIDGTAYDGVITKEVKLYGPGDIVGIDSKAIIKVEPRDWITNFEPNYLPYIEFYDEDFAWRYTPAAPGNHHRLRPWIMLVVLKQGEFEEGKNVLDKPLSFIKVLSQKTLPLSDDLWAWAHVHVNRSLNGDDPQQVTSNDIDTVIGNLEFTLAQNPDLASCRIICPRKLEPNETYFAFLVPVFEAGRLAGLGMDLPTDLTATKSAWSSSNAAIELPVYYRWQFSTGTAGDFEYLVRLLKPKTANPQLGRRDMDAQLPGANLPPWQEAPGLPDGQETEGIFKLGGALRTPLSYEDFEKIKKYELWSEVSVPDFHPFQKNMVALLNLEDDYKVKPSQDANQDSGLFEEPPSDPDDPEDLDPVITPPIYGRWHAKVQRLLNDSDGSDMPNQRNWIHELNLDPRFRTASGFGTKIIQENQEDYMFAAWKQIGDVLKANQTIRQGQMSLEVSMRWFDRHVKPMQEVMPQQLFFLTAPVHRRVIHSGITLSHEIKQSTVAPATVSAPMRRILRPRGRLMRKLNFSSARPSSTLLHRINLGDIHTAPPKKVGPSTPVLSEVAGSVIGPSIPAWAEDLLKKYPNLKWVLLVVFILSALLLILFLQASNIVFGAAIGISAIGYGIFRLWEKWLECFQKATFKNIEEISPTQVNFIPKRPNFRLTQPGETVRPTTGTTESEEGQRFRSSILDLTYMAKESKEAATVPPPKQLNFPTVNGVILDKIYPVNTIPPRVMGNIRLPSWLVVQLAPTFDTVMAYPKLDFPMYKPLANISTELFLPNIHLIENNTISLLKTNQKFIESYMVGLNHEFARELLWREYPTDQRGSVFRQFWDVSSVLKPVDFPEPKKENEQKWREGLYDIPEIHKWPATSELGDHDNRELLGQEQEEEVVLVVRGELLKKYPTAVIYAHKAAWALEEEGTVDYDKIRSLTPLTAADEADLEDGQVADSNKKLKTPLYSAKIEPDIYFFGFNLTVEEVKGAKGDEPDAADRPGWFFVIKERPGEPRFGLDIDQTETKNSWSDLSWEDVNVVNGILDVGGSAPSVTLEAPVKKPEETDEAFQTRMDQFNEDKNMNWSANTNAAELAYILYQVPVLVAIHGSEILPDNLATGDF